MRLTLLSLYFIWRSKSKFVIIYVYFDDLNTIGTPKVISKAVEYLKKEFDKDLGKTKFCLGIPIVHFINVMFIHQSTYTEKVLKRFYMDKSHLLSTAMVVRSLDINKDIPTLRKRWRSSWWWNTISQCYWGNDVPCQQ